MPLTYRKANRTGIFQRIASLTLKRHKVALPRRAN
jgi:hypothetical protein